MLSDSAVARGAIAKGRSSSHQLRPILLRVAADLIAGGIYIGLRHAPARLNIADDPTRSKALRQHAANTILEGFGAKGASILLGFAGLSSSSSSSSSSSGWVRLSFLLVLRVDRDSGFFFAEALASPFRQELESLAEQSEPGRTLRVSEDLFDATLGYPGEGPLQPRHKKDEARKLLRSRSQLPTGRTVLQRTSDNRLQLLKHFEDWLHNRGVSAEAFWAQSAEAVANLLATFGRELFDAGFPYWHYAETTNAISAKRPVLRRQLQGAWDLAFSWMALEPHTHHTAMPSIVLLALLTVCLMWGWRAEAGIFGLSSLAHR